MKTSARFLLLFLSAFLAITAIPGGIALMIGYQTPPLEMLSGSPFQSFVIPGTTLAMIVGGSALLAFVLLLRKSRYARYALLGMACIILIFETVEILVIGSPEGVARILQIVYIALGVLSLLGLIVFWDNKTKQQKNN